MRRGQNGRNGDHQRDRVSEIPDKERAAGRARRGLDRSRDPGLAAVTDRGEPQDLRLRTSMREALEEFRTAIRHAGLHPPEVIVPDGKLQRFPSNGTRADRAGWYVFFDDDIPAGVFGDWRSGVSETWRADIGRTLTAQEKTACRERREALRQERDTEDTKRRAEARRKAAAIWRGALQAPSDHPYLLKKGIGAHELRVRRVAHRPRARGHDTAEPAIHPLGWRQVVSRRRACAWLLLRDRQRR